MKHKKQQEFERDTFINSQIGADISYHSIIWNNSPTPVLIPSGGNINYHSLPYSGTLPHIHEFAEIVSFCENAGWIFAVKKNTEVFEGTIRTFGMSRAIILSFLSHRVFPGKVKQNPTMQTRKLSATDYLIIVYNKIIAKASDLNKLQEVFASF